MSAGHGIGPPQVEECIGREVKQQNTEGRSNSKVSPMFAVYQSVSPKMPHPQKSYGRYPEVHLRSPLALLERHTTARAESANNNKTIRSAALPTARLP